MKYIPNSAIRSSLIPTAWTLSLLSLTAGLVCAEDFTRSADGTSSDWSDASLWTPTAVPNSGDSATFDLSSSTSVYIDGNFAVNDLQVDAPSGGRTLTFVSPTENTTHSLTINGTLSKANNSTNLSFQNQAGSNHWLNVSIGTLDLSTNGGTINFGRSNGTRVLNQLSINQTILGGGGGSNSIGINLNISNDYTLGKLTFNPGDNEKKINLITNDASASGYSRTATSTGISDTSTNSTIAGSLNTSQSANEATLRIATESGQTYQAATSLTDGTGGTLTLRHDGAGTQILSGDLSHTGGTYVDSGTLVISGTLASEGSLSVSSTGTLVAANALTSENLTLADGATLGFNLEEDGSISLSGDLLSTGSEAEFIIDFRGTGNLGESYNGVLSITGSSSAFEGSTLSFINFSDSEISGDLTFDELTNGFTIIPEPSQAALFIGAFLISILSAKRIRK